MKNTFYDLTMNWNDREDYINPFLQDAPLFNSMPMMETNAKLANVTNKVKSITTPQVIDFDAPLPEIRTTFEKTYAVIGKVGGKISLGLDKIELLGEGLDAYVAAQLEPIMNQTGQDFDKSFMYNIIKAFCLQNEAKCVTRCMTGQTANTGYYSMIGISWRRGENCGLYNPDLSGAKLFKIIPMGGGAVINIKNDAGQEIPGKQTIVQTYMGMQLPRPDRVHALVNIKPGETNGIPTPDQLLEFVSTFSTGNPDNDVVYCHPTLINKIRAQYMRDNQHADFIKQDGKDILIDDVRVVKDPNMLKGEEAAVTD